MEVWASWLMVGMGDGELAFNAADVIIMEGLFQGARNAAAHHFCLKLLVQSDHTAGTSPACSAPL